MDLREDLMIDETPGSRDARSRALLGMYQQNQKMRKVLKTLLVLWRKLPSPDDATKQWIAKIQEAIEDT
jgi:hypothetical protein